LRLSSRCIVRRFYHPPAIHSVSTCGRAVPDRADQESGVWLIVADTHESNFSLKTTPAVSMRRRGVEERGLMRIDSWKILSLFSCRISRGEQSDPCSGRLWSVFPGRETTERRNKNPTRRSASTSCSGLSARGPPPYEAARERVIRYIHLPPFASRSKITFCESPVREKIEAN